MWFFLFAKSLEWLILKCLKSETTNQTTISAVPPEDLQGKLQDVVFALAIIEQLRGGSADRAPLAEIEKIIDGLIRGIPYIGYECPSSYKMEHVGA
jgi:hypothetical protein